MDPEEPCPTCKHERKWHDPCSKCRCTGFGLPIDKIVVRRRRTKS